MKGIVRKADIVLGILLAIVCAAACRYAYSTGTAGAFAEVTVNGEIYGTYSLAEDTSVDIDSEYGHNTLTIRDGKAVMTEASCPDGYCLNQYKQQGGIDASNQTIVCLPNRVAVSVRVNGKDGEQDGAPVPDAIVGQAVDGGAAADAKKSGNGEADVKTDSEGEGNTEESGNAAK